MITTVEAGEEQEVETDEWMKGESGEKVRRVGGETKRRTWRSQTHQCMKTKGG